MKGQNEVAPLSNAERKNCQPRILYPAKKK